MQTPHKEDEKEKEQVLDLALIGQEFSPYQHCPEVYLIERIQRCNPWPEKSEAHILGFLKSISGLYKAIPYHNITHAFDVMTVPLLLCSIWIASWSTTAGRNG